MLRGGVGFQPGLTSADGVRNRRKSFSERFFPRHQRGSRASGSSARRPMPHTEAKGLVSAKCLCPCSGGGVSWSGSVRTWQSCQQERRLRERGLKPRCRSYARFDQRACPRSGLAKKIELLDAAVLEKASLCLLYTSPSPRDKRQSRMPSSA